MVYKIRIRRQERQKSDSYWQEFEYDGSKSSSVATVLKELNSRTPLKDNSGNIFTPISWECSCMMRKCGACAMLINERPRLACSTFLHMVSVNLQNGEIKTVLAEKDTGSNYSKEIAENAAQYQGLSLDAEKMAHAYMGENAVWTAKQIEYMRDEKQMLGNV